MMNFREINVRVLILADLTIEGYLQGIFSPSACACSAESISPYIHGNICSPGSFQKLSRNAQKRKYWLRLDWTPGLRPSGSSNGAPIYPVLDPASALSMGADFAVATLLLPNAAQEEAENVRHLAALHTASLQAGIPMAIDIHLRPLQEDDLACREKIIQMSYNLAVELGADAVILPGAQTLLDDPDLIKIKSAPILARCPAQSVLEDPSIMNAVYQKDGLLDGIILTGLGYCKVEDFLPFAKFALQGD